jgi:hydrogenase expression/formation protein HypE
LARITLTHGAGGTVMQGLINDYIVKYLGGSGAEVPLEALDDSAVIDNIVLKSDSHTVKPLFFEGGDMGRLAIAGTVNDISVLGADPVALTSAFVLEESFPLSDLEKILVSMRDACREAGVYVITGDTKVVEKGALDQFIINTSGIGRRSEALDKNIAEVKKYRQFESRWLIDSNLKSKDKIIVSGTVGDHGIAILIASQGYPTGYDVKSDVAPLNRMIKRLLYVGGIVNMKDPTRGGLSNTLNEWSEKSKVGIIVREDSVPVTKEVREVSDMAGIDPFEIGNEGKIVLGVVPEKAEEVLAELKRTKEGSEAQIIGEVTAEFQEVVLEKSGGGRQILNPPIGDPIPRIC